MEVLLTDLYKHIFNSASPTLTTRISLDGGSNFGSTAIEQEVSTLTNSDYTQGSSTNTWGLDWSGFTDLNQLAVSLISDPGGSSALTAFIYCELCQIKVYYIPLTKKNINILSGQTNILGGQVIIK